MSRRRTAFAFLAVVVLAATGGWILGRRVSSPAGLAANTAAPAPRLPVIEILVRGSLAMSVEQIAERFQGVPFVGATPTAGVMVAASELFFTPSLPVRVAEIMSQLGEPVDGVVLTVTDANVGRFDQVASTEILVESRPAVNEGESTDIPWDAENRLARLNGVVAVGTMSNVDTGESLISAAPVSDPLRRSDLDLSVVAVSHSIFPAVRATLSAGRFFDQGFSDRGDGVALLGAGAGERFGVNDLSNQPAIRIGDELFVVAGIVAEVGRQHDILGSVLIPEGTARRLYHLRAPERSSSRLGSVPTTSSSRKHQPPCGPTTRPRCVYPRRATDNE